MDRYFQILKSFVLSVFFIHPLVNCRQSRAQFRTLVWANGTNFDCFMVVFYNIYFVRCRACIGESVAKMVTFMFVANFFFSYEASCLDKKIRYRRKSVPILGASFYYDRGEKNPNYVNAQISFPEDFSAFVRRRIFN